MNDHFVGRETAPPRFAAGCLAATDIQGGPLMMSQSIPMATRLRAFSAIMHPVKVGKKCGLYQRAIIGPFRH
jgi:hypothetical protein